MVLTVSLYHSSIKEGEGQNIFTHQDLYFINLTWNREDTPNLTYPNPRLPYSICGVHQIGLTSPPIENIIISLISEHPQLSCLDDRWSTRTHYAVIRTHISLDTVIRTHFLRTLLSGHTFLGHCYQNTLS